MTLVLWAKTANISKDQKPECFLRQYLVEDVTMMSFYEEDILFFDFEWFIQCLPGTVVKSMSATFEPRFSRTRSNFPNIKPVGQKPEKILGQPDLVLDYTSCISLEYLSLPQNILLFCSESYLTQKKGAYLLSIKDPLKNTQKIDQVNFDQENLDFMHAASDGFARHYQYGFFDETHIILSATHKTNQSLLDLLIVNSSNLRIVSRKTVNLAIDLPLIQSGLKVVTLEGGTIIIDLSKVADKFLIAQISYNLDSEVWSEIFFKDVDTPELKTLRDLEFYKMEGKYGSMFVLGRTAKDTIASARCLTNKNDKLLQEDQQSTTIECKILRQTQLPAPFYPNDKF